MKVITVCQPYAGLIADREKPVENRSWATRYRGPLLIHAGKSRSWLDPAVDDVANMVFGAVVARANLLDCVHINDSIALKRYPWLPDHPHAFGPFCLILGNITKLPEPVPARGKQGLWDLPWPPDGRTA